MYSSIFVLTEYLPYLLVLSSLETPQAWSDDDKVGHLLQVAHGSRGVLLRVVEFQKGFPLFVGR